MMILWDIGHLTIVALSFCVFVYFLPLEDITIHKLSRENDHYNVETHQRVSLPPSDCRRGLPMIMIMIERMIIEKIMNWTIMMKTNQRVSPPPGDCRR